MDISDMLVGKSEQLDNVDLLSGPRDFTITAVSRRDDERQPLDITLAEYDRPWRPGLTMRRLLAQMWGVDASVYVGRRVRLYRDPEVTMGRDKTGGTRISHGSNITKSITVSLPTAKGKFGAFTVEPLTESAQPISIPDTLPEPTEAAVTACTDRTELGTMWKASGPERRAQIEARVATLDATAPVEGDEA